MYVNKNLPLKTAMFFAYAALIQTHFLKSTRLVTQL